VEGTCGKHLRKALLTRGSGPPSGAACWAVVITHATTCAKAEGLDWRPSDSRGGVDDHRPPTNRERGGQEIGDTIREKIQSTGGIFHRVHAAQRQRSAGPWPTGVDWRDIVDGDWKTGEWSVKN